MICGIVGGLELELGSWQMCTGCGIVYGMARLGGDRNWVGWVGLGWSWGCGEQVVLN